MITTKQIMNALESILHTQYPGFTIYTNLPPAGFTRPSLLIQPLTFEAADASASLLHVTERFKITVIDETDDYDTGDPGRLQEIQQAVLGLFSQGTLWVEDRHIKVRAAYGDPGDPEDAEKVRAVSGGRERDRAYIDLRFEYMENRPAAESAAPVMETIETIIKPKG